MNIEFADEKVFDRFVRMSQATAETNNSLDKCINRLMHWYPHDAKCIISCDFDELSFFFSEVLPDGRRGICGGIIYHGKRDGFGSGAAPTFSVCLEPTDGYAIHT